MQNTKQPSKSPCCATDCCQSGCEDCPYDYKSYTDPTVPAELTNFEIEPDNEYNEESD